MPGRRPDYCAPRPHLAVKLKALRLQVKAGVDALARGDFVDIDDADLDGYLEQLADPTGDAAR